MNNPLRYAERIAYSTKETLRLSHDLARKYNGGVFVEAGVAAGAQIIAMASGGPDSTIYACDSFEGIPLPSNRDDQMPGISRLTKTEQKMLPDPGKQELISSGATVVSLKDFHDHIQMSGVADTRIITVKGWFEHTIPHLSTQISTIHILRLDGDLYYSTWICLQYLFPLVGWGCPVVIDDIELPGCKAAVDEYFEYIKYTPDYKHVSNIVYFLK